MKFLYPEWPAPVNVHAATTLKTSNLNLAWHNQQRELDCQRLIEALNLPTAPVWLNQEHAAKVINISHATQNTAPIADASFTTKTGTVCAVMTADCVPILLCNTKGTIVAAIHAGWRSQVAGVIEKTIQQLQVKPQDLLAWIGPAISGKVYEVGEEVYRAFVQAYGESAMQPAFTRVVSQQDDESKWLADLNLTTRYILQLAGIKAAHIFGGEWCTYSNPSQFHSARRQDTGRMVSLIWLEQEQK